MIKKRLLRQLLLMLTFVTFSRPTIALPTASGAILPASDTVALLRDPDIHDSTVVMSAGGDLWIEDLHGQEARKLTALPGREMFPRFSPDGRWIAFTAETTGRPQVYVIAVSGGEPTQLTFDPSVPQDEPTKLGFDHQVVGWSPDGLEILYRSSLGTEGRSALFYGISRFGGFGHRLKVPGGGSISYSPNGSEAVFTPLTKDFNLHNSWRGYRGGMAQDLWRVRSDGSGAKRLTATDRDEEHPVWRGNAIFFLAETGSGPMNVERLDLSAGKIRRITFFRDFDARGLSGDLHHLVFDQGGDIWRIALPDGKPEKLRLRVPVRVEARPPDAFQHLESISLAGDACALTAMGDVFVRTGPKPEFIRVAPHPGERKKSATLTNDGKRAAFVSDRMGEDRVFIASIGGGEPNPLAEIPHTFLRAPKWSPDGLRVAVHDVDRRLWILGADGSRVLVDTSGQRPIRDYDWSPDGRWLVYEKLVTDTVSSLFLFDVATRRGVRLSDPAAYDSWPAFDPVETVLYFVSRRVFSPIFGRFDTDYALADLDQILRLDLTHAASNFAALEGRAARAESLPIRRGVLSDLVAVRGALIYRRRSSISGTDEGPGDVGVFRNGKESEFPGAGKIAAAEPEHSRIALIRKGKYRLVGVTETSTLEAGAEESPSLLIEADPRTRWHQMIREAWRWENNIHFFHNLAEKGWPSALGDFEPFVDRALDRDDINDLMGQMISRLGIGHLWAGEGDTGRPDPTGIRALGVTFRRDEDGSVRLDEILDGAPYAEPRGPLAGRAESGQVVLAIDGARLGPEGDPYRLLAGTPGSKVRLDLASDASGKDHHEIEVTSIESEFDLRFASRVARYRDAVLRKSHGRCGYLAIPKFDENGIGWFARQFYGQIDRPCLLVDIRGTDGGSLAETVLERLARRPHGWNSCRLCGEWPYPAAAYAGKLVALIDGRSSSDGDVFAYFFREYGLGPLVGEKTWGGVIGGHGIDSSDGGEVTAADFATTGLDRRPEVENHGVRPDVEVVAAAPAGDPDRDEQLDVAIREGLSPSRARRRRAFHSPSHP